MSLVFLICFLTKITQQTYQNKRRFMRNHCFLWFVDGAHRYTCKLLINKVYGVMRSVHAIHSRKVKNLLVNSIAHGNPCQCITMLSSFQEKFKVCLIAEIHSRNSRIQKKIFFHARNHIIHWVSFIQEIIKGMALTAMKSPVLVIYLFTKQSNVLLQNLVQSRSPEIWV